MRTWIFGGTGMLGRALAAEGRRRDVELRSPSRLEADVTEPEAWREALADFRPELVFNCAAFTRVDECEERREVAFAVNGEGAGHVAREAAALGARCVQVSTDYVFDGRARRPYPVEAPTGPLSVYGASKLEGERRTLEQPESLVVRTSWLFGPGGANFVETMLGLVERGVAPLEVVDDQTGRPTYTPYLARGLWDLAAAGATGVAHYANDEPVTWCGFAREIMRRAGTGVEVKAVTTDRFPRPAARPAYSVLDVTRSESLLGRRVESWRDGLRDYLAGRPATAAGAAGSS